jgi:hypothetical protein
MKEEDRVTNVLSTLVTASLPKQKGVEEEARLTTPPADAYITVASSQQQPCCVLLSLSVVVDDGTQSNECDRELPDDP